MSVRPVERLRHELALELLEEEATDPCPLLVVGLAQFDRAAERLERRRDIRDVVQRGDGMSRLCALRHVGLFATPSGNHYTLDKSTFMNTFSKASGIRTDVL